MWWCAVCIVVDSYCPSTPQADACSGGGCDCHRRHRPAIRCLSASPSCYPLSSGGGHDCHRRRRPAICCLSVSCLSCRPSSIATAHPPCKQILAAVVVMLIAVVALSSVKSSVVDSCYPSTLQVDACSGGGHACRVVIVLISGVHQRLVICRVVSSVIANKCPSTLQADACSGDGCACRHCHRATRRPHL